MRYIDSKLGRLFVALSFIALNTGCNDVTNIRQQSITQAPPPPLPPGAMGAPGPSPLQNPLPAQLDPPPIVPDPLADTASTTGTKPDQTDPTDGTRIAKADDASQDQDAKRDDAANQDTKKDPKDQDAKDGTVPGQRDAKPASPPAGSDKSLEPAGLPDPAQQPDPSQQPSPAQQPLAG